MRAIKHHKKRTEYSKNKVEFERKLENIFGVTYDGIKELLINQYRKETRLNAEIIMNNNTNENNSLDELIDSIYADLSICNSRLIMSRHYNPRFLGNLLFGGLADENLYEYNVDPVTIDKSVRDYKYLFVDGLSLYYELLLFIACIFDFIHYPGKWKAYFNKGELTDSLSSLRHLWREVFEIIFNSQIEITDVESKANNRYKIMINRWLNVDEYSKSNGRCVVLSIQLVAFIKILINKANDEMNAFILASRDLSYLFAYSFYEKGDYKNAIRFSKLVIISDDQEQRQKAFNLLGLSAVDSRQYQLSYDVYYSWINKCCVNGLSDKLSLKDWQYSFLESMLQSELEIEYRNKNPYVLAMMYGNLAYVCSKMSELFKTADHKYEILKLAQHYIELALQLDPNSSTYLSSAGSIYAMSNNFDAAIESYKKCYKNTTNSALKTATLRKMIYLFQSNKKVKSHRAFNTITQLFSENYKQLLESGANDLDEIVYGRNLYVLLDNCSRLSKKNEKVKRILFDVDDSTKAILEHLKRTPMTSPSFTLYDSDCVKGDSRADTNSPITTSKEKKNNKIAYYTTLANLKYLFVDNKEYNNMNCLTMMHARYMNDPEEGLIIFQDMKDFFMKTPEVLRDILYDQKYVFLKSFTGLVDQLNMWTMYGSDRTTGDDCNGCCVCLAPETFDSLSPLYNNSDLKSSDMFDGDYSLYDVAYLDGEKIIVSGERDEELEKMYQILKNQMSEIYNLTRNAPDSDIDLISDTIVRLFEKLMFLFKDVSYSLESESRIVVSRDINDDRKLIHKTEQEPPKIYINPPFQVFPEKIIIGPKVENADYWMPHLQYELSKIHDKWNYGTNHILKPEVRKSKINIR